MSRTLRRAADLNADKAAEEDRAARFAQMTAAFAKYPNLGCMTDKDRDNFMADVIRTNLPMDKALDLIDSMGAPVRTGTTREAGTVVRFHHDSDEEEASDASDSEDPSLNAAGGGVDPDEKYAGEAASPTRPTRGPLPRDTAGAHVDPGDAPEPTNPSATPAPGTLGGVRRYGRAVRDRPSLLNTAGPEPSRSLRIIPCFRPFSGMRTGDALAGDPVAGFVPCPIGVLRNVGCDAAKCPYYHGSWPDVSALVCPSLVMCQECHNPMCRFMHNNDYVVVGERGTVAEACSYLEAATIGMADEARSALLRYCRHLLCAAPGSVTLYGANQRTEVGHYTRGPMDVLRVGRGNGRVYYAIVAENVIGPTASTAENALLMAPGTKLLCDDPMMDTVVLSGECFERSPHDYVFSSRKLRMSTGAWLGFTVRRLAASVGLAAGDLGAAVNAAAPQLPPPYVVAPTDPPIRPVVTEPPDAASVAVRLPHSLSKEAAAHAAKLGVPVAGGNRPFPNQHASSAVERSAVNQELVNLASRDGHRVFEAGTSVRSMAHARRVGVAIHGCAPTIDAADAVRHAHPEFPLHEDSNNTCSCRAEDCVHASGCEVGISVHVYFDSPMPIAAVLARLAGRNPVFYYAVHTFEHGSGSFWGGEAQYSLSPDHTVDMTVDGNASCYHHDDQMWLVPGHSNEHAVSWQMTMQIGHTKIFKFVRDAARRRPLEPLTAGACLNSVRAGPIVVDKPFRWGYNYPKHVLLSDSNRVASVDKELLNQLVATATHRDRNASLMDTLAARARTIDERNSKRSACSAADATQFAVPFAFACASSRDAEFLSAAALRAHVLGHNLLSALWNPDLARVYFQRHALAIFQIMLCFTAGLAIWLAVPSVTWWDWFQARAHQWAVQPVWRLFDPCYEHRAWWFVITHRCWRLDATTVASFLAVCVFPFFEESVRRTEWWWTIVYAEALLWTTTSPLWGLAAVAFHCYMLYRVSIVHSSYMSDVGVHITVNFAASLFGGWFSVIPLIATLGVGSIVSSPTAIGTLAAVTVFSAGQTLGINGAIWDCAHRAVHPRFARLMGSMPDVATPVIPDNSSRNVHRAIVERLCRPRNAFDTRWVAGMFAVAVALAPFHEPAQTKLAPVAEFLEHFPAAVRRNLYAAGDFVRRHGFPNNAFTQRAIFVKLEGYRKAVIGLLPDFAPRLIESCSPFVQRFLGRWIWSTSKTRVAVHTRHATHFWASGVRAEDIAAWFTHYKLRGYMFFSIDRDKHDSSVRPVLLHGMAAFGKVHNWYPAFVYRWLQIFHSRNAGSWRGEVGFETEPCVVTGEPNTSHGNWTLCVWAQQLCLELACFRAGVATTTMHASNFSNVRNRQFPDMPPYATMAGGDDMLVAVRADVAAFYQPNDEQYLGLRPNAKWTMGPECNFFSMHPFEALGYWHDGDWVEYTFLPNLPRALAKFFFDASPDERLHDKLYGKSMCLGTTYAADPLLGRCIELGLSVGPRNFVHRRSYQHKVLYSNTRHLSVGGVAEWMDFYKLGPHNLADARANLSLTPGLVPIRCLDHLW